ncbi:MAG: DUF4159 domain-containing protein [Myxococcales bacterium]|nr:DUF4159 domain-containing protein [Myxococcales bacterium]MCB9531751.1 DUF4159 domain-containing protein [Myxococcales bacterium]
MPTLTRRQLLAVGAALAAAQLGGPRRALAFGDDEQFDLPLIEYDGPWSGRPNAVRRVLQEVEMTTSVLVVDTSASLPLTLDGLLRSPIAVLWGDRGFAPLTDDARTALATWLGAGGLLFIDGADTRPDGDFDASVRRELAAILPDAPLTEIGRDHVLWRTFYIVERNPGRLRLDAPLYGATRDDRLAVIYSTNDVLGAWSRDNLGAWDFEVVGGDERQRDLTLRFGVNLAMYALCLDYKEDQVHVNYLLRRRRWTVDPQ